MGPSWWSWEWSPRGILRNFPLRWSENGGVLELTVLELQGREVMHRFRGRSRPQTAGRGIHPSERVLRALTGFWGPLVSSLRGRRSS